VERSAAYINIGAYVAKKLFKKTSGALEAQLMLMLDERVQAVGVGLLPTAMISKASLTVGAVLNTLISDASRTFCTPIYTHSERSLLYT